jgi:hypothetical protein
VVELHLAKVVVAGSSPVSRSIFLPSVQYRGRHSQVVRRRSAKPLFPGSNPGGASRFSRRFRVAFVGEAEEVRTITDTTESARTSIGDEVQETVRRIAD